MHENELKAIERLTLERDEARMEAERLRAKIQAAIRRAETIGPLNDNPTLNLLGRLLSEPTEVQPKFQEAFDARWERNEPGVEFLRDR